MTTMMTKAATRIFSRNNPGFGSSSLRRRDPSHRNCNCHATHLTVSTTNTTYISITVDSMCSNVFTVTRTFKSDAMTQFGSSSHVPFKSSVSMVSAMYLAIAVFWGTPSPVA